MEVEMIVKAIRYYAISTLIYIFVHPLVERVCENYGFYSVQHWTIAFLSFMIGTAIIYLIMKLEEKLGVLN